MSCKICHEKQKATFRRLSEVTGKIYVEYRIKNNHYLAEKNDFEALIEMGEIPESTPSKVL